MREESFRLTQKINGDKSNVEEHSRAKRGVRGARRGVLIPSALLAVTPLIGVAAMLLAYLCRAGVLAGEGVPCRKRRWGGGAMDSDCSTVPSWGGPSISISSISDVGKSTLGGDDIWIQSRTRITAGVKQSV